MYTNLFQRLLVLDSLSDFFKTLFYISNEVRARQKQLQLFLTVEPTDPEWVKKAQPHPPFTESYFSDEVRLRQKHLFLAAEPTDHSSKQDYVAQPPQKIQHKAQPPPKKTHNTRPYSSDF